MFTRHLNKALVPIFNNFSQVRSKHVDLSVSNDGIATVAMQKSPVNGLNLELLTELHSAFEEVENKKVKGMILTSALGTVFSGGLDILEMYKPDQERVKTFWTTLQDTWLKLYGLPVPTAALINGHSPAGGCLLAISCEYRVMLNNFTIGLNETKLGIVAPEWFMAPMKNAVGSRQAELALTSGTLFKTEEALKIGLIDEIASDKDDALNRCLQFFKRFDKISPLARAMTKTSARKAAIESFLETRDADLEQFLFFVNQPMVQKGLGAYIESLKNKKK